MIKIKKKGLFLSLIASLMMVFTPLISASADTAVDTSVSNGQNGTTLVDQTVTATPKIEVKYNWTIDKSVTPKVWNLFQGDTGTSKYTISVTKDSGTEKKYVEGVVTEKNGGTVATDSLAITVKLTSTDGKKIYISEPVDVTGNPILDPGETGIYNYKIDVTNVSDFNATYKVQADITILNHSGSLGVPFGPSPSSDGFTFLNLTPTYVNDSVNVIDTMKNPDGTKKDEHTWSFNGSGSETYCETFNSGTPGTKVYDNTATITETGQSASASVTVNTYALGVSKNADTSFERKYNWTIDKKADQSALTLALNQQSPIVTYTVVVNTGAPGYIDSKWAAAGTITIHNPAPMAATINSVNDIVSPDIKASIDFGVTFPYTLPAEGDLNGTYTVALPDTTSKTNTATATLQNYAYDYSLNPTLTGTTDFSGTVAVSFDNAKVDLIDESVNITDTFAGTLGTVSCNDVLPKTFTYTRTFGPYNVPGTYEYPNTATFTTIDTNTTGSSSWKVTINVPSQGATLTIGYWKTHAGIGPQKPDDMVTKHIPIWLGTTEEAKSVQVTSAAQAVDILNKSYNNGTASNGINNLYAQLLATKLNIANGCGNSDIQSTITAADTFLATYNNSDWSRLSKPDKNKVLDWATTLDNYNNGLMDVPHASQ